VKAKAKAKKGDAAVDDVAIAASKAGGGAPRGAAAHGWAEGSLAHRRALKGSDSLGSEVEFLGGSPSKLVPEEHRGDASYLVYILYDFQT
jgi:hypothetical protein